MFHAILDSGKIWKQIVDALTTILTEALFVMKEDGIYLRQVDPLNIAMIDMVLPAEIFQEYSCKGTHDICLGVDELTKISKRMAVDDKIELSLDEDDNRFEIKMIGPAVRKFKLQMIKPLETPRKPRGIEFDVKAEMFADAFKQAIKDVSVVSINVKIIAQNDTLIFTGEGDTGEAEVALKVGEDSALFDLDIKTDSYAIYPMKYLSDIIKAVSGDSISLQFSTHKPIQIGFGIAEIGTIKFLVAPRKERR